MTRLICFAVPDSGEWVAVPREALQAAEESLGSFVSDQGWSQDDMDNMNRLSAILAAPPCRVVELPSLPDLRYHPEYRRGFAAALAEIERRANESR